MRSPFAEKRVECPVCRHVAIQPLLKTSMLCVREAEADGHVTRYGWQARNVKRVKPSLHRLLTCPRCCFTDLADDYVAPSKDPRARGRYRGYAELIKDKPCFEFINFIYKHIYSHASPKGKTHANKLAQYFLALFAALRIDVKLRDPRKIADLYLNAAWIYREEEKLAAVVSRFTERVRRAWNEAPRRESDALACAERFYILAFMSPRVEMTEGERLKALGLISELAFRVGDLERALRFFAKLDEALTRGRAAGGCGHPGLDACNAGRIISELREARGQLIERSNARDEGIISAGLAYPGGIEEIKAALKAGGLHPAQIEALARSGRLAPQAKKGLGAARRLLGL